MQIESNTEITITGLKTEDFSIDGEQSIDIVLSLETAKELLRILKNSEVLQVEQSEAEKYKKLIEEYEKNKEKDNPWETIPIIWRKQWWTDNSGSPEPEHFKITC